jgi:RND family efflux transporter MFP subunit
MVIAKDRKNAAPQRGGWTPFLLLAGGLGISFLIANGKPAPLAYPAVETSPLSVAFVSLTPESRHLSVSTQGTLDSRRKTRLTAQVNGAVTAVSEKLARGQAVNDGEMLLQIDPRDYEIALKEVAAQLADAQQVLAIERGRARQAKHEWRDLGSADANNLFLRKPQLASAEAGIAAGQAKLERAQLNLQRTKITSPYAGVISQVSAQLGQYLPAGGDIGTVTDTGWLELKLPVSSHDLSLLPSVKDGIEATLFTSDDKELLKTTITRLQAAADPQSRFLYLIADIRLNDDSRPLFAGQFVEAKLQGKQFDKTIAVPQNALRARDQLWIIAADQSLQKTTARVLQRKGDEFILAIDTQTETVKVITSYIAQPKIGMSVTGQQG